MNFLDNTINFFSPAAGSKRLKERKRQEQFIRKYEGAGKSNRTKNWNTPGTSAESEVQLDMVTLRNRSRDLCRNNPHAVSIINEIVSGTVGTGVHTRFKHKKDRKKVKVQAAWKTWADSKQCDFDRKLKLNGLLEQIINAWFESGEVLVRFRYSESPFSIQVLECDHIADHYSSGELIKNGIEYDDQGRVTHYHLFKDHPGNSYSVGTTYETIKVPVEELLHVFKPSRPGQKRGVPGLHSVIIKLKDIDDFEDAEIVRQKISSCFTAFVHDMEVGEDLEDEDGYEIGEKVAPGQIEILPPGKDVKFGNPSTKNGYSEFMNKSLHSVAAGPGVTYEAMTGDYSNVNFSSAKMGQLKFQRKIRIMQKRILIDQVLEPIVEKFLESLPLLGLNSEGVSYRFIPPRVEMIDPTKEMPALKAAVRSGFESWSGAVASLGEDPEELLEELRLDKDNISKLELTLDSDPNTTQNNGTKHSLEETESKTEES